MAPQSRMRKMRGLGLVLILAAFGCRTNPDVTKQEYVKSGDRSVAEKKYAEAIVQYRNALQQDPKFGEARTNWETRTRRSATVQVRCGSMCAPRTSCRTTSTRS